MRRIFVRVGFLKCSTGDWTSRTVHRRMRAAREALIESSARTASVDSSNSVYNEVSRRSVSDLYAQSAIRLRDPCGIPPFQRPFGRELGDITAHDLWLDPAIARGVLGFLGATQAMVDRNIDAEPGKIFEMSGK